MRLYPFLCQCCQQNLSVAIHIKSGSQLDNTAVSADNSHKAILTFTIIGNVYNWFFVYSHFLKYRIGDNTGKQIGITPLVMA